MSVQVRARREAASFLASYVGAQGELLVDTTNNRVQVHDGATPGGSPAAKLSEVVTNTRSAVADSAYTAVATDRTIAVTSLTAARTITLPAASAYPTGTQLLVFDESGACSGVNTIAIARAGSDTINGGVSSVISTAYGYLAFESNGVGKWTVVDQTASAGTTASRTPVADANYTTLPSDRLVGYVSLTAARTVTLPAASAFPVGTRLLVLDESGAASATNTITLTRAGSDAINGAASATIVAPYGYIAVQSNGTSKWTITDQPAGSGTASPSRTTVADSSYAVQSSDRLVAYTALTAARTATLPPASAFPTGAQLFVVDETGSCSATNTITIARTGSDVINGAASAILSVAYGYLALESNGSGKWTIIDQAAASGTATAPRGHLSGLTLANNGTNPNTQLDVSPGVATADDNTIPINLASTITKTLGAWVVGSGNGGLDAGSTATTTWYHVFLIQRTDTNVVDVLFSLSPTSPTLPASYTKKRRIGSVRTTGTATNFTAFSQFGDDFQWRAPANDINNGTASTTPVTIVITAPLGIKTKARLRTYIASSSVLTLYSLDESSGATQSGGNVSIVSGSGGAAGGVIDIITDTSSRIGVLGGSSFSYYINTYGWIDARGK